MKRLEEKENSPKGAAEASSMLHKPALLEG